jgi:uncharacterized protein (TIGR02145 family)
MKRFKSYYLLTLLSLSLLSACAENTENQHAGPSSEVPVIGQDSVNVVLGNFATQESATRVVLIEIQDKQLIETEYPISDNQEKVIIPIMNKSIYRIRIENDTKVLSHSATLQNIDSTQNLNFDLNLKPKTYIQHKIQFNEELPIQVYAANGTSASHDSERAWWISLDASDSALFTINEDLLAWSMKQKTNSMELNLADTTAKIYSLGKITTQKCGEVQLASNEICDARDSRIYRTLQLGSRLWLGEDLKFQKEYEMKSSVIHAATDTTISCLNQKTSNCDKLAVLYSTELLKKRKWQGFCPSGWNVASYDDWLILLDKLGSPINKDSLEEKKGIELNNEIARSLLMIKYSGTDQLNFGGTLPVTETINVKNTIYTRYYPILDNESLEEGYTIELSNSPQAFISKRNFQGSFPLRCVK